MNQQVGGTINSENYNIIFPTIQSCLLGQYSLIYVVFYRLWSFLPPAKGKKINMKSTSILGPNQYMCTAHAQKGSRIFRGPWAQEHFLFQLTKRMYYY